MFLSLGIQMLVTDHQGKILLFSIFPLPELCLLCIYPCFKTIPKALNKELARSVMFPVRKNITVRDNIKQGYLSMRV